MKAYTGPDGETYWGEPLTDDERELVDKVGSIALIALITGV